MAGTTPQETDRLVGEAIGRGDVDAILDLFEPDAVFIDPGSGAELRGHAAIREAVEGMLRADPVIEPAGEPQVFTAGDLALVISSWTLQVVGPDGERVRQAGTATDVMRQQADGSWRYVIDNPSGVAVV